MNIGNKSEAVRSLINKFMGVDCESLIINGYCPCCKEEINRKDFKSHIALKEYDISGMCQKCQDIVFSSPDE